MLLQSFSSSSGDKQIVWTTKRFLDDLFVLRFIPPWAQNKKTFIPYIYNASNKNSGSIPRNACVACET